MTFKKPMLASACKDITALRFPLLASPKLDGIRCVTPEGQPKSRSLKPIKNDYIREELRELRMAADLDGELVTLNEDGELREFNDIQGDIMRRAGEPDWQFLVFDSLRHLSEGFADRFKRVEEQVKRANSVRLKLVPHVIVATVEQLEEFEAYCVNAGYEGVMIRDLDGPYKQGRSTVKQQWLLKIKRFMDAEGVIAGFEELMRNDNAHHVNELGKMVRFGHRAGMVPADTMGAVLLRTVTWGAVKVGSGFSAELRDKIWHNQDLYLGKSVTFRYQASGMKIKPRFPTFKGFRHEDDT